MSRQPARKRKAATLKQQSQKAIDANRRRLGIEVETLNAKWG
jgi:hypothetical protein